MYVHTNVLEYLSSIMAGKRDWCFQQKQKSV